MAQANVRFIRRETFLTLALEHSVSLNKENQEKLKCLIYTTLNCGMF